MKISVQIGFIVYNLEIGQTPGMSSIYNLGFTKELLDEKGNVIYATYSGYFKRKKFKKI